MKLMKFLAPDGSNVYINPESIVKITKALDKSRDGCCDITLGNGSQVVRGDVDKIASAVVNAQD